MGTSSTVQSSAKTLRAGAALVRFWRIVRKVRADPRVLPAGLYNLTPHIRRDIGLESRAAVRWLDATACIDRDFRRP